MKKIFLILLLNATITYCQAISQKILIGAWQEKTNEISSTYLGTYQFFPDGKFKYNTNGYDGLQRVLSIKGSYKLDEDTLFLKVESTVEEIGGIIQRSEINTLNDSWEIDNAKVKEVKQPENNYQRIIIETCGDQNNNKCLILDKRKYYKIFNNPSDLK